jgi:lipoprotein signal peptidase
MMPIAQARWWRVKLGLTIGLIISLDQLAKWWATQQNLVTFNAGVSGGVGQFLPAEVWLLVTAAVLVGLAVLNARSLPAWPIISGLWIGGSLSNWLDRWQWGAVRDWLPVPFLNVHNNLADWAIFGGLMAWMMLVIAQTQPSTAAKVRAAQPSSEPQV